jgi:hypothetical protein
LHDAVIGERLGTPSAAVITTGFVDGAELMSSALGLPGYAFVVIGHPISSASDDELRAKAADTLRQAAPLLLDAPSR